GRVAAVGVTQNRDAAKAGEWGLFGSHDAKPWPSSRVDGSQTPDGIIEGNTQRLCGSLRMAILCSTPCGIIEANYEPDSEEQARALTRASTKKCSPQATDSSTPRPL